MKIHWSWKSVPELSGLTPKERKQICRKHKYKLFKNRTYWIALILYMISFTCILGVALYVQDRFIPNGRWSWLLLPGFGGLIGGTFGIIQSQIQIQAMLPYIRKDLGSDNTKANKHLEHISNSANAV
jgi:hypothetical protein